MARAQMEDSSEGLEMVRQETADFAGKNLERAIHVRTWFSRRKPPSVDDTDRERDVSVTEGGRARWRRHFFAKPLGAFKPPKGAKNWRRVVAFGGLRQPVFGLRPSSGSPQ